MVPAMGREASVRNLPSSANSSPVAPTLDIKSNTGRQRQQTLGDARRIGGGGSGGGERGLAADDDNGSRLLRRGSSSRRRRRRLV
jgi:hypothetical protein